MILRGYDQHPYMACARSKHYFVSTASGWYNLGAWVPVVQRLYTISLHTMQIEWQIQPLQDGNQICLRSAWQNVSLN